MKPSLILAPIFAIASSLTVASCSSNQINVSPFNDLKQMEKITGLRTLPRNTRGGFVKAKDLTAWLEIETNEETINAILEVNSIPPLGKSDEKYIVLQKLDDVKKFQPDGVFWPTETNLEKWCNTRHYGVGLTRKNESTIAYIVVYR